MKIPHQLHQFEGSRSLIVVAGKQDAHIYDAHNGTVDELGTIKLDRSNFFNDGPFYKARSQGGNTRSGPVREVKDQKIVSDFIKELKKHLDGVRAEMYGEVQVFAPAKSKNAIVEAMPAELKKKVTKVTEGNYFNNNPLDIIKKVHTTEKPRFVAQNKEERTILENADQANGITKKRF